MTTTAPLPITGIGPAGDASPPRERLRALAREHPDRPAIVTGTRTVAFGELLRRVESLARSFVASGLRGDDLVALVVRDELDHLVASLALLEAGVGQLSLSHRDPPTVRERLADRLGVTVVVRDDGATDPSGAAGSRRPLDLHALPAGRVPSAADAPDVDLDAPALWLTGSGTTGEPKVMAFSQRDLALQCARTLDFRGQRILRPAHFAFNNSKRNRLYALWQGATCVFTGSEGATIHDQCRRKGVTQLELSTIHAVNLVVASRDEGPLEEGVRVRVGGARVSHALRSAFRAAVSPLLYVSYGSTETSSVSIAGPDEHDERESVGAPLPGIDVDVVGEDGGPVAPGAVGEIRVAAPGMARAYLGDPLATARHFRHERFHPGDWVSQDAAGRLVVHGRSDDMMIMNGVNIFPLEIERVLESHPAVAAAAALPLTSAAHGQIPVAAVELRPGASCSPADLVRFARQALGLRAPRRVLVLDALPRNANDKIVRRNIASSFDVEGRSHG